ncbi:MAG: WCX domain-containing protein [Metallibacterium sp.]
MESIEFGVREVMRLGTKIEVLGPKDLRRALTKTLRTLVQRH